MRPRFPASAEFAVFLMLLVALVWALSRFYQPVRVIGLSMYPTLRVGDVAVVAKRGRATIGDIVLIASPGHELVLHRLVGYTPHGALMTQGDANDTPDREPVPPSEVAGRAVMIVPVGALVERWRAGLGYATMSAQSNTARH
jgi:signal peptidase